MENSAFFLSGLTEKKLAIAVTDHLVDIFLLVVKIGFFLRIKEMLSLTILLINTTTLAGHSR